MNFHSDASTLPSVRQARRLPAGTTLPSRAGEPGAAEEGPGLHTPRGGSGSAALSSPRQPARGPMNQRSVSAGAAPSRAEPAAGAGSRQRRAVLRNSARCAAGARGRRRRSGRAAAGRRGARRGRALPAEAPREPLQHRRAAGAARSSGRCSAARCHGSGRRERAGRGGSGREGSLFTATSLGWRQFVAPPSSSPSSEMLSSAGAGGREGSQFIPPSPGLLHRSLVCLSLGLHLRRRGSSSPGPRNFPRRCGRPRSVVCRPPARSTLSRGRAPAVPPQRALRAAAPGYGGLSQSTG